MKPGDVVRARLSDGQWYDCGLIDVWPGGCRVLAPNDQLLTVPPYEVQTSSWISRVPLCPGDVVVFGNHEFPGDHTVLEPSDGQMVVLRPPGGGSRSGHLFHLLRVRHRADVADLYRDLGLTPPPGTRQEALL